ncbi:exo-alpha-sialidase [Streptomyces lydicamycinicus]|uniref:Exo-alpha-sialidase n=1 Tax=Streptomyces lydicamycinicus TaxID=1546107 RepID=A0A0P4RIX8_9ACTN|nr:exo-alpha-sialidase [Streptomyces lydicamycinicus]
MLGPGKLPFPPVLLRPISGALHQTSGGTLSLSGVRLTVSGAMLIISGCLGGRAGTLVRALR